MSERDRADVALQSIRKSLKALGYDLGEITDEELEDGLMRVHRTSVFCALSSTEVLKAVGVVAQAWHEKASSEPPSVT